MEAIVITLRACFPKFPNRPAHRVAAASPPHPPPPLGKRRREGSQAGKWIGRERDSIHFPPRGERERDRARESGFRRGQMYTSR